MIDRCEPAAGLSSVAREGDEWVISTVKTPPVAGTSATSPIEVENVESSS